MRPTPILLTPGPTPVPPEVQAAMAVPMPHHRSAEFKRVYGVVLENLQPVFRTEGDVLMFTASGTGAFESAVANLVSPGDEVVVALSGNFGERFAALAAGYGADVVRLEFEWGQPVDADDLARVLEHHPKAKVLLLTHNETSTGLTNPLRELARVGRDARRIVVVDGVSSISSIAIETDAWGIDVAVSGSQKGWMAPPGIALVSVSERGQHVFPNVVEQYLNDLDFDRGNLLANRWWPHGRSGGVVVDPRIVHRIGGTRAGWLRVGEPIAVGHRFEVEAIQESCGLVGARQSAPLLDPHRQVEAGAPAALGKHIEDAVFLGPQEVARTHELGEQGVAYLLDDASRERRAAEGDDVDRARQTCITGKDVS